MPVQSVLVLGGQGYVGSAVCGHLLARGLAVRSVDLGLRGEPGPAPSDRRAYQALTAEELGACDAVVLLAGHASVGACAADPAGAFANNVGGFVDLVHKLRGQVLVYASSVSVCGRTGPRAADEADPLPEALAPYDLHKQAIERYARLAYPAAYGLRFGTVCGPAPNLRPELLLNGLVRSAVRDGRVVVSSPGAHRAVLGVGDLGRAVETILAGRVPPGAYHLASACVRIGDAAERVARHFGVPVVEVPGATAYDVRVSTARFERGAGFAFTDTVDGLIDALAEHYGRGA